jgi:hypothetical protein
MLNKNELEEIEKLAERAQSKSVPPNRRDLIRAGRKLIYVVPAIAAFSVPRAALGQTGSGIIDGGMNGMMNNGMMNNGMMNNGMMNNGMMN